MAETKNEYVHGSLAEKIKYDPYEDNAILKSKKTARNNKKVKARIVFNIFLVFAMFIVVMFRYAQISQLNYENNILKRDYTKIQNENQLLLIDIQNAMDLKNIRQIAETKLDMHKPYKSQIVYVSIPKKDVTITANKEQSKLTALFNGIHKSFNKFLNMIY
ncbi:cell division protein FtsL [Ruminiclostridium papyrosolvens DSM 2782]|uniref:Cell division protein FtsL n=1 Tax=Ruminiclostridium papyrosolvens DSM 2782 TaxID=588581 RepID=F1TG69_9FIRM|nr:cell division protein FtsL [Ruminiclostridium papyrosolvens]EGD46688.1 cell division protein FtsL [Ruminiclostridium papyrosolvens DSM 2782]WES35838.1 cell division protein FtsL [Ruminiclostridium papyrosolvens DSM 2782]